MKLSFTINYRLDSPNDSGSRTAKLMIPSSRTVSLKDKDEFLRTFCGEIAKICHLCFFYKRVQVMAPFLERPIRIKYAIVLPDRVGVFLDASLKPSELRRKAKELHNSSYIATKHNKSDLIFKHSILLTVKKTSDADYLENEYKVRVMTFEEAIDFFRELI